jgi:hypothetical protein
MRLDIKPRVRGQRRICLAWGELVQIACNDVSGPQPDSDRDTVLGVVSPVEASVALAIRTPDWVNGASPVEG